MLLHESTVCLITIGNFKLLQERPLSITQQSISSVNGALFYAIYTFNYLNSQKATNKIFSLSYSTIIKSNPLNSQNNFGNVH